MARMRTGSWLCLLSCLVLAPAARADPPKPMVVHAGRMLDVRTGALLRDRYISIVDGRIVAVSAAPPDGAAETIDLSDKVVLPGLISAHVHLLVPWPDYSPTRLMTASSAEQLLWGVRNARTYLDQGFTTVRDACEMGAGGTIYAQFALRDAIAAGEIAGPRIVSAGQCISVAGGHGDGYRIPVELGVPRGTNVADTADEIEGVVRRDIKYGADWIKLMATGGAVDPISDYRVQELSDAQLVRAVETAHRAGKHVMAHAEGTAGILAAARAGVDSIEHGTMLDEEGAKLMAQRHIWLVPTLACFQRVDLNAANNMAPDSLRKTRELLAGQQPAFERAVKHGIRIVFGDDDVAGLAHEEFGALVKGGLSPLQAIRAATIDAAEMLGVEGGVIEPGRDADLIAIRDDPTQDVTALYSVDFVMRAGRIAKPSR